MRKLVWFTVPFAGAVLVCVYCLSLLAGLLCAGLALLGLIAALLSKWKQRGRAAIALAGLCVGFLFCALYGQLFLDPTREADGITTELSAVICDYPEDTRFGCKAEAELRVNGKRVRSLLYLGSECRTVRPGDTVTLTAELRRSDRDRQGDNTLYYQAKGIMLLGYSRSETVIRRADSLPLRFWPVAFSRSLRELLDQTMPKGTAGLVQALLTGDRSGLRYAEQSDLSMAGVSHMIAISGMHVSILLGFLALLTRKRRGLTALLGIPTVLFFVFSTGCTPSVVRAAVMQILFLLAPLLRRENDTPTSMCAALLLLLLQNPYAIANVSLQLSFASMAGMLLCTQRLYHALANRKRVARWLQRPDRKTGLPRRLALELRRFLTRTVIASLTATLGAILFTTPLTALHFGTFSVYSMLSNLVILWAAGLCFVGGLVTALFGAVFLPLGQAAGWLVAWPVRYILLAAKTVAALPYASLPTASAYLVIWMLVSYGLLALGVKSRRAVLPICGILAGLALTILLTTLDYRPQSFKITALDVGQGQSLCLLTPEFSALYDCGGSDGDEAGQHAAEHLLTAGVRRLDALILSHYDEDHVGGLEQLLYRVAVDTLYVPLPREESGTSSRVLSLAAEYDVAVVFVTEETTLPLKDGGIRLLPPQDAQDSNAESLSLLFSCAGYDMLVTGDLDEYEENLLLHSYLLPQVELYVAGHHGSKNSSSMALLSTIRPATVLVSVGYNSYGHPSEEALARFAAVGAEVLRTDECGDITIGR